MKARKTTKGAARKRHVPPTDAAALSALFDLEPVICDVHRASRIALLMAMRELGGEAHDGDAHSLSMFSVEIAERMAKELREQFYRALGEREPLLP